MKKLLFLGACLLALALQPVKAQTGGSDVVVVRVDEGSSKKVQFIIAYGNASAELTEIELDAKSYEQRDKSILEAYQRVFQKLYKEGYRLKNTFTSGQYNREHSFFFEKKE
jgi:hypothetical protein